MRDTTKRMAEAFLRWPLPESVCADPCATKQQPGRSGTNLLSYIEAEQMMRDVVEPMLQEVFHGLEVQNTGLSIELEKSQAKLAKAREALQCIATYDAPDAHAMIQQARAALAAKEAKP